MEPNPYRPHVRTQADLEEVWRQLLGSFDHDAGDHTLWMVLVDADGVPVPLLHELDTDEHPPSAGHVAALGDDLARLLRDLAPGGSWAFLRRRPGTGGPTAADLAWARHLVEGCRAAGVPVEVVHLSTDVDLRPLPFDALAA